MRIRVDVRFGSVSFDEKDVRKAYDLYVEQGLRISFCKDIFDDGEVVDGLPRGVDFQPGVLVVH